MSTFNYLNSSELERLREALDLLSTEDGLLNRISRHNADEFVEAVAVVCAVGRRFLSLTEIGPDYRAAAIELIGAEPPDNYPGEWEQMITTVIEQTVKPVVDAALADYLTEEET